jgi:hypothetical protein
MKLFANLSALMVAKTENLIANNSIAKNILAQNAKVALAQLHAKVEETKTLHAGAVAQVAAKETEIATLEQLLKQAKSDLHSHQVGVTLAKNAVEEAEKNLRNFGG